MFISHVRAGTGAVVVETREEERLIVELLSELEDLGREFALIAAPIGKITSIRLIDGKVARDPDPLVRPANGQMPLAAAYEWASKAPGRVLVVLDWHMLSNAPGHWRLLIESLPGIRQPLGAAVGDPASLVVFVAPSLALETYNPLKGQITRLEFDPPSREALRSTAGSVAELPGGEREESIIDALCGLSSDTAEQVCAEVIQRGDGWDAEALRSARRQAIKEGGLELWNTIDELGGLGGFQGYVRSEVLPWIRDPQLAVKRILMAGVPGVGKSYSARWLADQLHCECARISVPSLKAGIVGASEANLRRCLRTIDAMAKHSPLVVVVDEIDTIARDGLDGGTSSGMFAELLTWLQESQSQAVVLGTLNQLDKLDAALESRFQARFFVDLPTKAERRSVAQIHFARLNCIGIDHAAELLATLTEGYSSREIAEHICPSVARLSNRQLDDETLRMVIRRTVPSSKTQATQLESMRRAADSLRRANDEDDHSDPSPTRRVMA